MANVLMLKGLSQNRGGEAPRTDISSTDRAACRDYITPRRDTNHEKDLYKFIVKSERRRRHVNRACKV